MSAVLPSIISEFETAEQETSYTAWLQAKAASMTSRAQASLTIKSSATCPSA